MSLSSSVIIDTLGTYFSLNKEQLQQQHEQKKWKKRRKKEKT